MRQTETYKETQQSTARETNRQTDRHRERQKQTDRETDKEWTYKDYDNTKTSGIQTGMQAGTDKKGD